MVDDALQVHPVSSRRRMQMRTGMVGRGGRSEAAQAMVGKPNTSCSEALVVHRGDCDPAPIVAADHIAISTDLIGSLAQMMSISEQHPRDDWKAPLRARFAIAKSAGIECFKGWEPILTRMLERLEATIAQQPAGFRHGLEVNGIREKFGVLSVYLSKVPTPEVQAILDEANAAAMVTCEVCGAPGRMADRHGWMSVKCDAHEKWSPADGIDDGPRRLA